MSKRAEEAAWEAYPEETRFIRDYNQLAKRQIYQQGYEQAEKDTIERALDYLYENLHMRQDEKEEWLDEFKREMEEE